MNVFSNKIQSNRYHVGGERAGEMVTLTLSRGELRVAGFALEDVGVWLDDMTTTSREMRTSISRQAAKLKKLADKIGILSEKAITPEAN